MQNKTFKLYIAPVVVLFLICLVISAGLALTYAVAHPVIVENTKKMEDEVRQELLPAADSFTEYDGDLLKSEDGKVEVKSASLANNGAGVVFNVDTKSFGGTLSEMIGVDAEGKITGVKVTNSSDTPGVGTKAASEDHLGQYQGLAELTSTSAKSDQNVQAVGGASVSSNAIHYGVYEALEQFKMMGGSK